MQRPQKLAAAFLSAALLCTTGIAFADKGGNHDKKGGPSQGAAAPGQSSSGGDSKAAAQRGPGGVGGPRSSPGDFDRSMKANKTMGDGKGSEFEGSAGDRDVFGSGAQAGVHVKLSNGGTHDFNISDAALASLKAHQGHGDLIFFTNGQQITAVCNRGEKDNMRVTARTGDTFVVQDQSGQSRMITLDAKTASRLHVKVGSNLQVTAMSATSGKVVALDLVKKHGIDKFARGTKTDVDSDVAKTDVDQVKADIDTPKFKGAKKEDVDAVKLDIDIVKADLDNPATRKSKKLDNDLAKLDNDKKKCDRDIDVAKSDVDTKKAKKSDVDVAKSDIDTKGHKAKNRKSDSDVADVDVKAGGMGKCGHGSSRNGNPAFANQMAKDAANDASGHNPPGLPHECVNPAGHTRGFCKSSSSESICGSGSGSMGASSDIDVASSDVDTKTKKAKKTDVDVAKNDVDVTKNGMGKCGHGSSRNGNPAFANQMAKDAANDASGHNPPGLPHECVNPAGHTRGFCKSSSSESMCGSGGGTGGSDTEVASNVTRPCAQGASSKSHSNPAFANQMAKDAANDASGHNPPGLPHECVNPAGHTRGFCKSSESTSSAMCGSGSSGGGSGAAPSEVIGGIANSSAHVPGTVAAVPVNGGTSRTAVVPGRGFTTSQSGTRGPGAPVGMIPAAGGQFAPGSGTRGAAGAPTHVLGASTGPASGRRIAALPTRVLPVAIQPVGKRRCVWYKTGVLGASTGPRYIVGTSAIAGKPMLHKKCR